jgi:hypothetical protein
VDRCVDHLSRAMAKAEKYDVVALNDVILAVQELAQASRACSCTRMLQVRLSKYSETNILRKIVSHAGQASVLAVGTLLLLCENTERLQDFVHRVPCRVLAYVHTVTDQPFVVIRGEGIHFQLCVKSTR